MNRHDGMNLIANIVGEIGIFLEAFKFTRRDDCTRGTRSGPRPYSNIKKIRKLLRMRPERQAYLVTLMYTAGVNPIPSRPL